MAGAPRAARSTRRDRHGRWLWRLVGPLFRHGCFARPKILQTPNTNSATRAMGSTPSVPAHHRAVESRCLRTDSIVTAGTIKAEAWIGTILGARPAPARDETTKRNFQGVIFLFRRRTN